ncbi:hypothetical protein [Methylobacterium sp. E-045]|jgi:hypothetical protein|uniref:hypothetical protein n=1 Tax=Methylobacterium sp. E-045 TaxID=2836575 RepID=UPI001FBB219C|nr:hypothetical protein [Methylobacterium sp. E-045]MCJ2129677.1 hypothetical protein [Methylobacterium sp. E-045]
MDNTSQKRALSAYRLRLTQRGIARFEVAARETDRPLIRSIARRLTEDGPDAARIRTALTDALQNPPEKTGGILAALRRSPLVGSDLELNRDKGTGRGIDL